MMSWPTLIHYSKKPLGDLHVVEQQVEPDNKPRGLWLSVEGDGWREWCEREGFALDRLTIRTEICLRADADILWLRSADELDIFTNEYGERPSWDRGGRFRSIYIAWDRVAQDHPGILIAPYIWARRLDGDASRWYYGWDCASGCIWDPVVIERVDVLADAEVGA